MQRFGEGEIVRRGRPVKGEVAAVDHEIGTGGVDIVPDRVEIRGELRQAADEVGVGDLGYAELGHRSFPSASMTPCDRLRKDDAVHRAAASF
jgi:hypothetical protein